MAKRTANQFSRINQPVRCKECGKMTTDRTGGWTGLCARCYDAAGLENEHQDGGHVAEKNPECPMCAEVAS